MKYNYLRYVVLALLIAVGSVSCDDDDTLVKPEPSPIVDPELPSYPALTLETNSLDLLIDETQTIEILDGAGEYKISVLDDSNVEASISGSEIRIKGLKYGNTDLVVSDQGGAYTALTVHVYKSNELTTSVAGNSMKLTLPMGEPASGSFTITAGNDPYTVASSDPETVSATLDNNGTTVLLASSRGQEEGESPVIVTITDARGLTTEISITTEVSDTPFTDEMLEQIKAISEKTFVMDNINLSESYELAPYKFAYRYDDYDGTYAAYWGAFATTTTNNCNRYCIFDLCSNDQTLDMKVVGKKNGMKLTYSTPDNQRLFMSTPLVDKDGNSTIEVIKAEENMSWVILYATDSKQKLHTGYMVLPWN